jgi:hypothetical protein
LAYLPPRPARGRRHRPHADDAARDCSIVEQSKPAIKPGADLGVGRGDLLMRKSGEFFGVRRRG